MDEDWETLLRGIITTDLEGLLSFPVHSALLYSRQYKGTYGSMTLFTRVSIESDVKSV